MGSTGASPRAELDALLHTIIARLMKMLKRRGMPVEEMGQTYLAEPDADGEEARTLRPLQAAAITYRIAFGPRAGQKVLTLRGAMPREHRARQPLCADIDGFSQPACIAGWRSAGTRPFRALCPASPCMPRCGWKLTTASGWSSCAATSAPALGCACPKRQPPCVELDGLKARPLFHNPSPALKAFGNQPMQELLNGINVPAEEVLSLHEHVMKTSPNFSNFASSMRVVPDLVVEAV